jgi:hypothetical protein
VTESQYQSTLIHKIKIRFPGCLVLKQDSAYQQGVPDLLLLYRDRWASLEVKLSATANVQPNQDYYIFKLNDMSFAAFVYPENEEEVLNALQQAFDSPRRTRVSESELASLD